MKALRLFLPLTSAIMISAVLSHVQADTRQENFTQGHQAKLESKAQTRVDLSYHDLAHEFPGCPPNSLCTKSMGEKYQQWQIFLKRPEKTADKTGLLEKQRKSHGLPLNFYTTKEHLSPLGAFAFYSRCAQHNLKDHPKVLKATQFYKQLPNSDSIDLDEANLKHPEGILSFKLPVEERPIMLANKELIVPMNSENLFYYIAINQHSQMRVVTPSKQDIKQAILSRHSSECPEDLLKAVRPRRSKIYCEKIWDKDLQRSLIVQLEWSCH